VNLSDAYARLRDRFGSHGAAAKELGLTQQHYNALRNGRANIPRRTADYIILKALELEFKPPAPEPRP
jgi:hypothetical protein